MTKASAKKAASQPTNSKREQNSNKDFQATMQQRNLFASMMFSMSWQLALVVLLPIVGGSYLDQQMNTKPVFILVGMALATIGVIAIVVRVVAEANRRASETLDQEKKK